MTRKDFELIAKVLRSQYDANPGDRHAIERTAYRFADALAHTNPRFDADRFVLAATGNPQ